jgi:diguanylate cyclase
VINPRVIELGLGLPHGAQTIGAFRHIIDRSLNLLRDWLIAFGDPDRSNDVCTDIDECLSHLEAGADAEQLRAMVLPCLDTSKTIVTDMRLREMESRNEMSTLITIVREAVAAVTQESQNFHSSLTQSTERFVAVAHYNDIHQIKHQILAEVSVLKRVVAERQQAWDSSAALLSERVAVLERQLQTSRQEASLDALTHIANRRTFDHTLREWMTPSHPGFVLAVIDIDGFKVINDEQGHAQGDRALVALAQTLKASVRAQDLVARLGGDEFALLISGLSLRQAEFRMKTVIAALASTHFTGAADSYFTLTVSAGVAEYSAGDTASSLLHRADEALYQAKHLGKNRVVTKASTLVADLLKDRRSS